MTYLTLDEQRIARRETSTTIYGEERKKLFWFQVLLEIIAKMPPQNKELFHENLSLEASRLNPSMATQKKLADFKRDYKSDEAIQWFTKAQQQKR